MDEGYSMRIARGCLTAATLAFALSIAAPWVASAHDTEASEGQEGEVHVEVGTASWYGPGLKGRPTASGVPFDPDELTAAHPTLPLETEATVTNLENGLSVEVEINDRGPFAKDRVIDLSRAAAEELDMTESGTADVRIEAEIAPDAQAR